MDTQKPIKCISLHMPKISEGQVKKLIHIRIWSLQGTQVSHYRKVAWKGAFNHTAFCTFGF